jgi:ADP-heptose:LPS heptosyltransferase
LAGVVSAARLVVCNDTGVSHVAAGRRVPSVIVCCGADASRFPPEDRVRHRLLAQPVECRPCMHVSCPIGHPCATKLTLDQVADAVFAQLRRFGRAREPSATASGLAATA